MLGSILLIINFIIQVILVQYFKADVNIATMGLIFLNGSFIVSRLDMIIKIQEEKQ